MTVRQSGTAPGQDQALVRMYITVPVRSTMIGDRSPSMAQGSSGLAVRAEQARRAVDHRGTAERVGTGPGRVRHAWTHPPVHRSGFRNFFRDTHAHSSIHFSHYIGG